MIVDQYTLPRLGAGVLRPYLGDDQVHQFVGHYDSFYYALAVYVLGYGWLG